MKRSVCLVALFLAVPGWGRQAWGPPQRRHVVLRFNPDKPRHEPEAGLTPRGQPDPPSHSVIPVFPFLIRGGAGPSDFLLGSPWGVMRLDSRRGVMGAWVGRDDVGPLLSESGRYWVSLDSRGSSLNSSEARGASVPFNRGARFGMPITPDERFLLSYNRESHELQWLPIHAADASYAEDLSERIPMGTAPDPIGHGGYLTSLSSILNPWMSCNWKVVPRKASLPPKLIVQAVESGDDPEAPWVLVSESVGDQLRLMRWNPVSQSWIYLQSFENRGELTDFRRLSDGSFALSFRKADRLQQWSGRVDWVSSDGRRTVAVPCPGEVISLAGDSRVLGVLSAFGLETWDLPRWKRTHLYPVPALHNLVFDTDTGCFLASRNSAPWLSQDLKLWDLRRHKFRPLIDPGPTWSSQRWHYVVTQEGIPLAVSQTTPTQVECRDLLTGARRWARDVPRGAWLDAVHPEAKAFLLKFQDGSFEVRASKTGGRIWMIQSLDPEHGQSEILECSRDPWRIARLSRRVDRDWDEPIGLVSIWDGLTGKVVAEFSTPEAVWSVAQGPRPGTWLTLGFRNGNEPADLSLFDVSGTRLWEEPEANSSWGERDPYLTGVWAHSAFTSREGAWVVPQLPRGRGLDPSRLVLVQASAPPIQAKAGEYLEFSVRSGSGHIAVSRRENPSGPVTLSVHKPNGELVMEQRSTDQIAFFTPLLANHVISGLELSYASGGMSCLAQGPAGHWVPLDKLR